MYTLHKNGYYTVAQVGAWLTYWHRNTQCEAGGQYRGYPSLEHLTPEPSKVH